MSNAAKTDTAADIKEALAELRASREARQAAAKAISADWPAAKRTCKPKAWLYGEAVDA